MTINLKPTHIYKQGQPTMNLPSSKLTHEMSMDGTKTRVKEHHASTIQSTRSLLDLQESHLPSPVTLTDIQCDQEIQHSTDVKNKVTALYGWRALCCQRALSAPWDAA